MNLKKNYLKLTAQTAALKTTTKVQFVTEDNRINVVFC